MSANLDERTVAGFGEEWDTFDQSALSDSERQELFNQYFRFFPWHLLPEAAEGFDLGCGSGRWAALVAPRVRSLHCIDASPSALDVARRNLADHTACQFHLAIWESTRPASGGRAGAARRSLGGRPSTPTASSATGRGWPS